MLIESLVIELEAVVVCAPHDDEINEQSCPLRDTGQTRSVPFEVAVLGPACTDGNLSGIEKEMLIEIMVMVCLSVFLFENFSDINIDEFRKSFNVTTMTDLHYFV